MKPINYAGSKKVLDSDQVTQLIDSTTTIINQRINQEITDRDKSERDIIETIGTLEDLNDTIKDINLVKSINKLYKVAEENQFDIETNIKDIRILAKEIDELDPEHEIARILALEEGLASHVGDINNPHSVTKAQLGLDKVQNASVQDIFDICHPVGELYVQFPGKSAPTTLYQYGTWTDITEQYAGLFFRAEGGNSLIFGLDENNKPITQESANLAHNHYFSPANINIARWPGGSSGTDSLNKSTGSGHQVRSFPEDQLFTVWEDGDEEARPVNTAIRIWERTA